MPEVGEELCDHDPEYDHVIRLHILEGYADAGLAVKLLKRQSIFLDFIFSKTTSKVVFGEDIEKISQEEQCWEPCFGLD